MGEISVILVKNNFFILLNKFNLHAIIYDSSSINFYIGIQTKRETFAERDCKNLIGLLVILNGG